MPSCIPNETARDKQIVHLSSEGYSAAEIGKIICLSERTVEGRIEKLRKFFECKNTPHLVATFLRNKIIE